MGIVVEGNDPRVIWVSQDDTDQHGQNTKFFSLKYGSPYIDFNRLEKTSYFLHFAQCYSICTYFKIFFVFLFC